MMGDHRPSEPVGWVLGLDEVIKRANAYLRTQRGDGLFADPNMSYRNLYLGLWIVNYIDPQTAGQQIEGGSVLVVPNEGDVYEISGLPGEGELIGVQTAAEEAGLPAHWCDCLGDDLNETFWRSLIEFIDSERLEHDVYPPPDQVFSAFHLTDYQDIRVVILGQDPYHGPGQAHGLCFSVPDDLLKMPPSLVNIRKELKADTGAELPSGSLEGWANQGVLLLNSTLTVRRGRAGSHRGKGWEEFTDAILRDINDLDHRVVFLLWGKDAQRKRKLITNPQHSVVESSHPSPLSAYRGFLGSRPFSTTNALLGEVGSEPIDWSQGALDS